MEPISRPMVGSQDIDNVTYHQLTMLTRDPAERYWCPGHSLGLPVIGKVQVSRPLLPSKIRKIRAKVIAGILSRF